MEIIIDYYICEAESKADVGEEVRRKIKEGWQPFGSLSVTLNEDENFEPKMSVLYSQPMVRYA